MENNFEKILREALRKDSIEISALIGKYLSTDADVLQLSKDDTKVIILNAARVNALLEGCINYVDAIGGKVSFNLANFILAIQDKTTDQNEKLEMINTLVCNWIDQLPDEWNEKFKEKYETEKLELGKNSNVVID